MRRLCQLHATLEEYALGGLLPLPSAPGKPLLAPSSRHPRPSAATYLAGSGPLGLEQSRWLPGALSSRGPCRGAGGMQRSSANGPSAPLCAAPGSAAPGCSSR